MTVTVQELIDMLNTVDEKDTPVCIVCMTVDDGSCIDNYHILKIKPCKRIMFASEYKFISLIAE